MSKLPYLRENGEVEVVVVVSNDDVALRVDAHADRVVGHALASDLTHELAFVREHLHI